MAVTNFQEVTRLILVPGLTLSFSGKALVGHLVDELIRLLFSLFQTPLSIQSKLGRNNAGDPSGL